MSRASIRRFTRAPLIAVASVMLVIQSVVIAPAIASLFAPGVSPSDSVEEGVEYALQFLLMSGNALLLAVLLFLRQAVARRWPWDKQLLGQATERPLAAAALLSVWVITIAATLEVEDMIAVWLFAFVPTLVLSFSFLWFAVSGLRDLVMVGLLLAGFAVLTACVQACYTEYGRSEPSETILVLNSILIGLAIAIWLLTVSRPGGEKLTVIEAERITDASTHRFRASPE